MSKTQTSRSHRGAGRMRLAPLVLAVAGVLLAVVGATLLRQAGEQDVETAGSSLFTLHSSLTTSWFEEVALASGIDFQTDVGHDERFYLPESMAGGVGLLDYDNDGYLDVYFVQAGRVAGWQKDEPGNRLFHNRGDATFEEVTASAGVGDIHYGTGCATGDFDNDGWTDLYVTNVGANILYRNRGDGTFTDVTQGAGVGDEGFGSSAAFLDYDRDGDLDLYVVNYIQWSADTEVDCIGFAGVADYCTPSAYLAPQPDTLYRNNGDGTFTDVSEEAGIHVRFGNGLGIVCGDFNGDTLTDICVANDLMANQLWINRGDGTFRDEALERGLAYSGNGMEEAGMGIHAVDVDNDGDLDVIMAHFAAQTNTFYRNVDGFFFDETSQAGLDSSRPFTGFGIAMHDFNNDGHIDIYVANGRVVQRRGTPSGQDPYADENQLFVGIADGTFREELPRGGTPEPLVHSSRGAAFGDLNNDGFIDIVIANRDGPAYVLRNRAGADLQAGIDGRHWIMFDVRNQHGAPAIGARVTIEVAGNERVRDVRTAYSYCAANDPRVHFGLGEIARVSHVRVTWPDGAAHDFGAFNADQIVTLKRPRS
ncbi:MAG: CRTAC1 family protein [Planctomycetes bacterium]|nr:CRTAC1 family protein [Planctomycetota bacterium]